MNTNLFTRLCLIGILAVCASANVGCYKRTVAPEITYEQAEVDLLDSEIKKLDWAY